MEREQKERRKAMMEDENIACKRAKGFSQKTFLTTNVAEQERTCRKVEGILATIVAAEIMHGDGDSNPK